MSLTAPKFLQELGASLAQILGGEYRYFKSRLELRQASDGGNNVLILAGSNKYSPSISLSFYFGRNFAAAKRLEKRVGGYQFPYHIQQYSLNRRAMPGLNCSGPYTWSLDINDPPRALSSEIVAAVRGIANPFFARFSNMEVARDAIASDDPWCFGGFPFWRQLLVLDAALNDLPHFQRWSKGLGPFERSQAEARLEQIAQVQTRVA